MPADVCLPAVLGGGTAIAAAGILGSGGRHAAVALSRIVRRFAFAHLALRTAIAVDLAVTVLQLAGLLLAFYFHCLSVPTVYAIMGGACAVACAAWFVTMQQPMRLSGARIIPDWRDHWSFGKWALAGQVAGLASCLLPWMLNAVHGATATGVLAPATR